MYFPFDEVTKTLVSLMIGGLLGREIYRIVDKPRVTIQYRNPITFTQEDGQFLSIRVGNVGRNAANKCFCTLTILNLDYSLILDPSEAEAFENLHEYKEEKPSFEVPRYQIVQPKSQRGIAYDLLCWSALGNPAHVDINPGTTTSIDVCKLFRRAEKEYFIFPSEFGWRRIRVRIRATKPLRCRVLVCPANDYPTPLDFEIFSDKGEINFRIVRLGFFVRVMRLFSKRSLYTK
jgi:hypothetical protein